MDQATPLATPEPALYIPPARPTSSVTPSVPPSKKKSKAGLVLGLLFGLVLILAGGTYAAARYGYITLPFSLPGTANDIIAKSLDALYNTTASESTSEFSIKIAPRSSTIPTLFPASSASSSNNTNTGLGLGDYDVSSWIGSMLEVVPDNLAISGSTTSYSEKTNALGKVDATMRLDATYGETKVVADLAMRLLEKNIYLKVNVLEGIPNIDASSVSGKWYTTDIADAAALLPTNTNAASDQELQKSKQIIQDVLSLAQKYRLFKTNKNFGTETIEGVKTRHTSHVLNPKQVVPFFEALFPVMKAAGEDTAGSDEFLAGLKKPESQTLLDNMSKALTMDLWYDGQGKIMKKMMVTMTVVPPASSVKYKASQFVLSYSTTLKSSGQKKTIETPTGAEPLETLMSGLLGSTMPSGTEKDLGTAETKARDADRKSHIAQISTGLTLYYDDHQAYPTSLDQLAPTYLETIPTDPTTHASYTYETCAGNHYLVSAALESSTETYYASDTGGPTTITTAVQCGDDIPTFQNGNVNISINPFLNTNADEPADTDNDGVDDTTETLCGTKTDTKDSDGDGYDDLTEIQNGYNPNGAGKATNELCKTYLDLQL